ncbi:SMI1/KNR4 family protein [Pseudanabaena galeata UHCC 0370]|uniref:SMI1/KNR4 family protein n=2 Tax=Pseudanabaena galeata TaxID=1112103 RepID=A0ABU5TIK9_9CYAN|nr:SMI1/KNR4 family protein [Pseudanabaena galeata UHCC 0370]
MQLVERDRAEIDNGGFRSVPVIVLLTLPIHLNRTYKECFAGESIHPAKLAIWKGLLDSGTFQNEDGQDQGCEPDLGVFNVWWSSKWIPLTYDGCGNHDCLDLAPAEGGNIGQIISMWHDDPERKILAPSFRDWLQNYAEELEYSLLKSNL